LGFCSSISADRRRGISLSRTAKTIGRWLQIGHATVVTRDTMGSLALDGIAAVLAGRRPENLVG
jgi:hypothetical protein